MAEQELQIEILKQMHSRYEILNEIYRLTGEIGDSLLRDDRVSVQMLIEMRQTEIENLMENEGQLHYLLECASDEERAGLEALIAGKAADSGEESPEEQKLRETGLQIQSMLHKLVARDRMVSTKLAGKDSFYGNQ